MVILEMVERVQRQAEADGGMQFISLSSSPAAETAPAGATLPTGGLPGSGGSSPEAGRPVHAESLVGEAPWRLFPEPAAAQPDTSPAAPQPAAPYRGPIDPPPAPLPWPTPGADPQWRPTPDPSTGALLQDPDFTLPTAAGPITWRLFHDSTQAGTDSEWGFGRRASFPLRLMSDGTTVTVMHEDGTQRQYLKVGGAFQVTGAKNGDGLVQNGDGTWDETRGVNQMRFHFPAGNYVSLAYSATPQGLTITHNYDAGQHLVSLLEPTGRRVTLGYWAAPAGHVQVVQDWADRRNTLAYNAANDLSQVQGPTGCLTLYDYDSSHRITGITDPEGFQTTYTWDGAGRVASMSVAGNLGRYTYLRSGTLLQTEYTDPLGFVWTHLTQGGYPVGQIDPLGNRQTYVYANNRLQSTQNALGFITTHLYDSNGLPAVDVDALGYRVTYVRDQYDNLLSKQNQLGAITTYNYGTSPQLQQLQARIDPLGNVTTYGYLANGLPLFVQDPLGNITTQVWSSQGLLLAEVNPLGATTTHVYDGAANEIATVDALGRRWTHGYDNLSRRVSEQNPLGAIWTTLFDARGLVQAEIDPLGLRTSFQWNAYGSQTALVSPDGTVSTTVYDAYNQAIASVDPTGVITTTVYDPAGRAPAVVAPTGAVTTTVFDAAAQAVASVNALGYRTTTVYTALGQAQATVDALGGITTAVYDATGAVVAQVAADSGVTTAVYDAAGRPVGTVDPLGYRWTTVFDGASRAVASVNPLAQRTTTVFDGAGQPIASVDALGFRTTTLFDPAGEPVALLDALGFRATTIFDGAARPVARVDALGGISTTVYDVANRVSASVNALSAITTALYDGFGRPSASVDARGFRTTTVFDHFGRAAATWDALGLLTTVLFDQFGRVTGDLDPAGLRTTTTFDLLDEPIAYEDAFSFITTTLFDALGRPVAVTNPASHTVTTVFDVVGRTVAEVNELGYRTSMSYDLRSSRTDVLNARGYAWTALFDPLARDYADIDPLGRRTTLTFDARSLVSQRTDGRGFVETRLYDALGRQTGSLYADGTIVTTTFDPLGRALTEANQNGVWTRSYDALGQRLTELGPGYPSGLPLTSVYDPVGNRVQLQTWRGSQAWGYDGLNRVASLVDIEGGVYTWGYDLYGRLQTLDYTNGVLFTATYTNRGWPATGSYQSPATQVWAGSYDGFDNVGNPSGLHSAWAHPVLGYDAASQLTSWQDSDTVGPAWVYDPAGNPSTAHVRTNEFLTYLYDGANELVNLADTQFTDWNFFKSSTFAYDGAGNRIGEQYFQQSPNSFNVYLTTYTWDPANQLLQIQQSKPGAVDLTNSYRPDGLRHRRTDNTGTTQIIWDGEDPLAQVDLSGNLVQYWTWAPELPEGRWSRLVKSRYPATNAHPDQYLHSDWLGTVVALSLPDGTALLRSGTHPRPWGEEDSAAVGPLSWVGNQGYWRENQLARSMHYVRARWYLDGAQGWLSADPLGFRSGDWNLYRYVKNRPTVRVDPTGMMPLRNPIEFVGTVDPDVPTLDFSFGCAVPSRFKCQKGLQIDPATKCRRTIGIGRNCKKEVAPILRRNLIAAIPKSFTCATGANGPDIATAWKFLEAVFYCLASAEADFDPSVQAQGVNETAWGLFQIGDTNAKNECGGLPTSCAIPWQVNCALTMLQNRCGKGDSLKQALGYWQATRYGHVKRFNGCMKQQGYPNWQHQARALKCDPCKV